MNKIAGKQFEICFKRLDKIKVLELTQNSKPQPINPVTKIQKDIQKALNLPEIDSRMG